MQEQTGTTSERRFGWHPGPGRRHFVPESGHFYAHPMSIPLDTAARVTARCVARWADRYVASSLSLKGVAREGRLPRSTRGRESAIDEVFDWLEQQHKSLDYPEGELLRRANVTLLCGDQLLLEQSDGIPGPLAFSSSEFLQLQDQWVRHGLPRDLYVPLEDLRAVVEPTQRLDTVILTPQSYTPRAWAQRERAGSQPLHVPTEEERVEAFVAACDGFLVAVQRRLEELSEAGNQADAGGERDRLVGLIWEVHKAVKRARPAAAAGIVPAPRR